MPLLYRGQKIIPAPLATITKSYIGEGEKIGSVYNISLQSTMLSYKGSPQSSGAFWTGSDYPPDEALAPDKNFPAILKKQEALRGLFSVDGGILEIFPYDGGPPVKCNPRVKDITFSPGTWYNKCDYEITLEADLIYVFGSGVNEDNFADKLAQANESWQVEEGDKPNTMRVSHEVSAVGKRFYDAAGNLQKPAWEQAKSFVVARLGYDASKVTDGIGAAFNYFRGTNLDEIEGAYAVTESWLLSTAAYVEDFNVTTVISAEDGKVRVSIEGSVEGLDSNASLSADNKYANALAGFAIIGNSFLSRAIAYSSVSNLNGQPLVNSVSRNPVAGIISYQLEFDDRGSNLIPGAISETIEIIDNIPGDLVAQVPVLARIRGPLLQSINTKKEAKSKFVVMQAIISGVNGGFAEALAAKPNTDGIKNLVKGTIVSVSAIYDEDDEESWEIKQGRYSRRVGWIYE